MAVGGNDYRSVLADVAGCLEDESAKELAFELEIPPSRSCRITNGIQLMREMEKTQFIKKDNVDKLLNLLRNRNQDNAADLLEEYKNTLNTTIQKKPSKMVSVPTPISTTIEPAIDPDQGTKSSDRYSMTHNPRGHCLILMYDTFSNNPGWNRSGNEVDRKKLKELFGETILQFQVSEEVNLNLKNTKRVISSMAKKEHGDCLVVFVSSHGDDESFTTSDGLKMKFQDMLEPFKPQNCSGLSGKPKIFFINTCLGKEYQNCHEEPIRSDGAGLTENLPKLWAKEADFCICLSTVPGYIALRHTENGTFYVQHLYKCFLEHYKRAHLTDILTYVRDSINNEMKNKRYRLKECEGIICQVSPTISGLLRKVYFSS